MEQITHNDRVRISGTWPDGVCGYVQCFAWHWQETATHFFNMPHSRVLAYVVFDEPQSLAQGGHRYDGEWFLRDYLIKLSGE